MADVVKGTDGVRRCAWGASTPDYAAYHDDEWGRPVVDDTRLYEKLCLEGLPGRALVADDPAQARELPQRVQGLRRRRRSRGSASATSNGCMQDAGHRAQPGKIEATIANAASDRVVRARARLARRAALVVRAERSPHGAARVRPTSPRRRPSRRRSRRRCCGSGSASSARRPSTPRCSRRASSTITSSDVRARAPCEAARKATQRPGPSRSPR